ncbi:sigma-54-dependent Fis family transcriptional regulator [Sandaracinus amylolyticus]|uniref:sigma-54-dependent Fis family transcriptional regulator n=1 Tax=Sandaracinus amylolyticus TaxID=927083 RepID=UPI001EFFA347|nr:sigma 54-interacting transcriptional regulator [Sandaracinus amylolyticus]UJR79768.1 Sigma-54 dependent transcriptional regulator, Fis family [Sandaracinus amylolyticus]
MSATSRIGPGTGVLATDAGGTLVLRRVRVRVASGPDRGAERELDQGTMVVGSHPQADLVLTDSTVSRYHAELALLPAGVRVKDLRSTNGTFVGESRIESVLVPVGSEVRLGRTRVELLPSDVPLPDAPSEATRFGRLVGSSPAMRRLFGQLERVAATDVAVLLHGEPGVGKTEAARAIHDASSRARGPFVVIELGGVPAASVSGAMGSAIGGTLLLERIDEASGVVQDALSAALDRREREGIDVRVLATSRGDPRALVERGALRRDLWFHLASVRVEVPALRDRLEDLPRLVHALLEELGYPELRLGAAELGQLRAQRFDGNVRELRRTIEETLLRSAVPARPSSPPGEQVTDELARMPFKEAKDRLLDAFERGYVAQLLERAGGNLSRAAAEAGLDRNHLARLAKKHNLR